MWRLLFERSLCRDGELRDGVKLMRCAFQRDGVGVLDGPFIVPFEEIGADQADAVKLSGTVPNDAGPRRA
jgi:hypothetical protein